MGLWDAALLGPTDTSLVLLPTKGFRLFQTEYLVAYYYAFALPIFL